ncbi:ribonuclease P protein subunit p38-like [Vespula squamosa]|uniref:Ribonuclease P protein subunit p38-like n=1 Tax=Vespula squamosa TaxID=30214 RepID=A0ABD2BYB1_VESSQ
MSTPVLTKQQQRRSLSAKKGPIKLRNVLAQPHDNYWSVLNEEDNVKLSSILIELFPALKRSSVVKKKGAEIELKEEPEISKKSLPNKDIINSVYLGINTVTRSLEKNTVCCVLLDANVEPPFLIKHIIMMAQMKKIPFLLVPFFKVLTLENIGFKCSAFGLKKEVLSSDHYFYTLYNNVLEISKNYPASSHLLQIFSLDSEVNNSVPKENTLEVNKTFIPDENVYKFRSSRKERIFIPPNAICNTSNVQEENTDFISIANVSLNDNDNDTSSLQTTRYFNFTLEKHNESKNVIRKRKHNTNNIKMNCDKKKSNDNIMYLPLKVKQLRGNSNRTKATKVPKNKRCNPHK